MNQETLIFNTHTDGQGFVEENGGVAFVQLARHSPSLPARRLKRTLVLAAWPGTWWPTCHRPRAGSTPIPPWSNGRGRADRRAPGPQRGDRHAGVTRDTVRAHGIPRAALLRPPVPFGVGAAFQSSGVPQIGAVAGPEYLLTISDTGDLAKPDEYLAARQIRWLADLARRIDRVPAAALRHGDLTRGLVRPPVTAPRRRWPAAEPRRRPLASTSSHDASITIHASDPPDYRCS